MKQTNQIIAKAMNGTEILVSLVPLNKIQNTRTGFKMVEVGKQVLLQSGIVIDLNLDGCSFFVKLNQLFRLHI